MPFNRQRWRKADGCLVPFYTIGRHFMRNGEEWRCIAVGTLLAKASLLAAELGNVIAPQSFVAILSHWSSRRLAPGLIPARVDFGITTPRVRAPF